jgi:hypothetical protein
VSAAVSRAALVAVAAPLLSLTACSFSFSSGGPNYDELEKSIVDQLSDTYSGIGRSASSVTCPRSQPDPRKGDTFVCDADVDGEKVRVEVTVKDDEGNVRFSTLDVVYDLPRTERLLDEDIEAKVGFPVTVKCGTGLKIVPVGDGFTCTVVDRQSVEKTVEVTVEQVGKDSWRFVD